MANLILIEASSESASVALSQNGSLHDVRFFEQRNDISSNLVPYVKELLQAAHIPSRKPDAIAVSIGPGSYTGLRVGLSTAKGLCYTWNIPVLTINTLDMMAWAMKKRFDDSTISTHGQHMISHVTSKNDVVLFPMMDARRMEVFTAGYNLNGERHLPYEALILDQHFGHTWQGKAICLFGSGAAKAMPFLASNSQAWEEPYQPSAEHLLDPAQHAFDNQLFANLAYVEPFYLKGFYTTGKPAS